MQDWRCGVVLLATIVARASDARAQEWIGCGEFGKNTWMYQAHAGEISVKAHASTLREWSLCPIVLQSEVWIQGYGGAAVQRGSYYAEAWVWHAGVGHWGTYAADSNHWAIYGGFSYSSLGTGHAETTVEPPPGGGGDGDDLPCDTDPAWPGCDSPLLLDTAGDGFKLTSVRDGVPFDINADGNVDQVAWTRAGSDDAWLAWDRNGNGTIDNGSELFGTHMPIDPSDADSPRAANGFAALVFTENPVFGASLADNVADANDAVWLALLLWRDMNHNGISEPEELTPAARSSLLSIGHAYKASKRVDRHGNEFRLKGHSTWATKGAGTVTRRVYDVWLRMNTDIAGTQ